MVRKEVVEYVNFKPADGFANLAFDVYQNVNSSAPPYSDVKIRLEKVGDDFSGYGTVLSSDRTFVGYGYSKNIYEVLKNVEGQLQREIRMDGKKSFEPKYKYSS